MLEIKQRRVEGVVVFELSGPIDIDSSIFIEKIGSFVGDGYNELVCSMENVTTVDYSGLSVLSIAYKNVLNHKGKLKFCSIPVHITKIFNSVGLDKVFDIHPDINAAVKSYEDENDISKIKKIQLRRRFKRLDLNLDIEFKSKKEETFQSGKIYNMSGIGILVSAQNIYSLGEILEVKIPLKSEAGQLNLQCKVAWLVRKDLQPQIFPGMGLEFYRIDALAQEKILDFVDKNLPTDAIG